MMEQSGGRNQDLERAQLLRKEAEALEYKDRVRKKLEQLMEISQDPYYDSYLNQMLKDLNAGVATPLQVEREAQRSFRQYQERMAQRGKMDVSALPGQIQKSEMQAKIKEETVSVPVGGQRKDGAAVKQSDMEFKVGVYVFSALGAAFVLAAFVIFGFNFLSGFAQGMCLYGVALLFVLLSELLLEKKSPKAAHVLTGIGIGGLYAANIVNFLALHTISGMAAMAVTVVIAFGTIFLCRMRESVLIRIISLLGCFVSFFPVTGFENELSFLIMSGILLVINLASVFLVDQRNQTVIDCVHLFLHTVLFLTIVKIADDNEIGAIYQIFYLFTAFVFVNTLMLIRSRRKDNIVFTASCIVNGICVFGMFITANIGADIRGAADVLFAHLLTDALLAAVCTVVFLLWNKEDGRRWAQFYFAACPALFMGLFSDYLSETILTMLCVLVLVKIFNSHRELYGLDGIAVGCTVLAGMMYANHWQVLFLVLALIVSLFRVKSAYLYHEITITTGIMIIWSWLCGDWIDLYCTDMVGMIFPIDMLILLGLFLMMNHVKELREKNQLPYNLFNLVVMALCSFIVSLSHDWIRGAAAMVIGTVVIVMVFRERYRLAFSHKYLLLAGYLAYFSVMGFGDKPVLVSVILMVIALGCVGLGFAHHDKVDRICGLVTAIIVCVKLVVYDFKDVDKAVRPLVFLIVGVIALVISGIYIHLEKRQSESIKENSDLSN